MIPAVVANELLRLLRGTCFRVVLIGYLLLLTGGYVVFYSEFATLEGIIPETLKHAFGRRVCMSQTIWLTALTPWVVSRTALSDCRHTMVKLIALSALPPWKMISGKLLATSMYLCQLLFLSLPMMILTHLLGAMSASDIVWSYVTLFVWLTLVQLNTWCWSLLVTTVLPSLVLAYAALLLLSAGYVYLEGIIGELASIGTIAGIDVCLGLLILRRCGRHLMYLKP